MKRAREKETKMFTRFFDMHSGGGQKLDWPLIIIEAGEEAAVAEFERRFGRDPHNVTCDCCGSDYSVRECETLAEAERMGSSYLLIPAKELNQIGQA